ncbi:MAG TPA: rhodanese-like domain-containing protein [Pyrinomonadaceae bacterium]|nr:rhodanese-like domain-containing protein [Pyrinomonadaceae bacterium]
MRIFSSLAILVLAIAAAVLFGACNSTERTASKVAPTANPAAPNKINPAPADTARRVNVKEAQDLIASGRAVVVDVRNQAAFDQGHIRGAKLIPFAEVADRSGELPRDKTIITYCS